MFNFNLIGTSQNKQGAPIKAVRLVFVQYNCYIPIGLCYSNLRKSASACSNRWNLISTFYLQGSIMVLDTWSILLDNVVKIMDLEL